MTAVACAGPKCEALRGKDFAQWTTCHSCVKSPVHLCPKCVHRHFASHQKRPVQCYLIPQPDSERTVP